ncbi:MAG: PAAR domain-containing protein [Methyloceanibacter sp.]
MFINGKPGRCKGDQTGCDGSIVSGASGVFINGNPMARVDDTAGGRGRLRLVVCIVL